MSICRRPWRGHQGAATGQAGAAALLWGMMCVTSSVAAVFLVPVWKEDLKHRLDVNDTVMDWMAFSLDAMNFFAVLPGFVLDRFGATVVFAGSACNNLVGFTLLTLGSRGNLPVEAAIVSMPFLGQASIWAVMATLSVLGQLIVPEDKGKAIGCCMTWFSLAPVVVKTLVYAAMGALSHPEVDLRFYPICGLVLLSGGLVGVLSLLAVPLGGVTGGGRWFGKRLGMTSAVMLTLVMSFLPVVPNGAPYVAAFLPAAALLTLALALWSRLDGARGAQSAVELREGEGEPRLGEGSGPARTPWAFDSRQSSLTPAVSFRTNPSQTPSNWEAAREGLASSSVEPYRPRSGSQLRELTALAAAAAAECSPVPQGPSSLVNFSLQRETSTLSEAVREPRYWLLFVVFGIMCGTGLEVSNQLSALAAKIQWDCDDAVAYFAVGNSSSRVLVGAFSDMLARWVSKGSFLISFGWVMCLGLLLIIVGPESPVLVKTGILLCGFSFGPPWMLVPALEMEWYGEKHFGRIHGVMMLAAVIGCTLLTICHSFLSLAVVFSAMLALLIASCVAMTAATCLGTLQQSAPRRQTQEHTNAIIAVAD